LRISGNIPELGSALGAAAARGTVNAIITRQNVNFCSIDGDNVTFQAFVTGADIDAAVIDLQGDIGMDAVITAS